MSIKEESHTLREWQKILANDPELAAEFDSMTPPSPIRGSIQPASEGLEEAAENHIREVIDAAGHPGWDWETRDVRDAFIAGAEWQKAKMLEGAVEANLLSAEGDSCGIVSYTFQGRRFPAAFTGMCFSYKIIVIKDEK